jgi:small membrane protein
MTLIQFLIISLAFLVLFRTAVNFKKNKITFKLFIFWLAIWGAVIIVAFLPQITNPLSRILGVGRGVDVAIYFAIVLIFFLLYKIMARLEKIDNEITKIVRERALKNR